MYRFGPSGIPLSCKGRTLRHAVEDVHKLGLTALEAQLVRTNVIDRYAMEEEIGFSPLEVDTQLIVEVIREIEGEHAILPIDERIEKGDIVRALSSGIAKCYGDLKTIGELSKELDVQLSLHSPYYIELTGSEGNELTEKSIESIRWGGLINHAMGGKLVVTHLGLYEGQTPKKSLANVEENITFIQDWFLDNNLDVKIGIETSGKQEIFGSLEEILKISRKLGVVPVINFAHLHARCGGCLKDKEDFEDVIEKTIKVAERGLLYSHFSGVEHEGGNEIRLGPIKKGDLKFETLAEAMLDGSYDMTVISSSPLLEHDAMYMKVILERGLSRRLAKQARREKAEQAKEEEKDRENKEEYTEKPKKDASKPDSKPSKTAPNKAVSKSKATSKSTASSKPKPKKTAEKATKKK